MNHLTEKQLNEYLDQMLDERALQEVEAHLAICDQCRAQLDELGKLFSSLADLPELPLARDLMSGVLARLPKERHQPTLWRQPAFILQSLLTIILLAVSMPLLRNMGSQVSTWVNELVLPTMQFPQLSEVVAQLKSLLAWKPQFTFAMPAPSRLPTFASGLDANILLILVITAVMLWLLGNFSLLKSKSRAQE